jgi:membrane dipeptidase
MNRHNVAAVALLRDTLVWDNHGCMPVGRPLDTSFLPQLERYRASGVDVVMLNIGFGEMGVEEHLRTIASLRHWLLQQSDRFVVLDTAEDIELARSTSRLAVGFDIEGANAIGDQLSLISLYYDLGVRWMLLAYNRANRAGGGCQEDDPGLTAFGRDVIAEMERVGMVVCLSHTGHRTVRDTLELVTKPAIFSHSNPKAVTPHPRNIPDELIRSCAETGGVIGVNGFGDFLGGAGDLVEAMASHVDHVVQLVGPEHVGIGLDYVFDTVELENYLAARCDLFPPGLGYHSGPRMVVPEDVARLVEILLGWGYSTGDLQLILGGNWMRVARQVWKPHGRS